MDNLPDFINIAKLSPEGQSLFADFIKNCLVEGDEKKNIESANNFYLELLKSCPREDIRFVELNTLEALQDFPRFPDDDRTVTLSSINTQESFLIFISHCWNRGGPDCPGWTGQPHPDSISGDKFKICLYGLRHLKNVYASSMKNCYVWFDYCCMNQDSKDLTDDLENYYSIVECCDCIFTPVLDNRDKERYFTRAWCRVEMLYASYIPLLYSNIGGERQSLFSNDHALSVTDKQRPHFMCELENCNRGNGVSILPQIKYSFLISFHPLSGQLTVPSDINHIRQLMSVLQPLIDSVDKPGYKGDIVDGKRHGHGLMIYDDGGIYEGEWSNNVRFGYGNYRYGFGYVYTGSWRNDVRCGQGRSDFSNGDVYVGEWFNDQMHGKGHVTYRSGSEFNGDFRNNEKYRGYFKMSNGNIYDGYVRDSQPHGHGVFRGNGFTYEGQFKFGLRDGVGVFENDSFIYEGTFQNNNMHGQGVQRLYRCLPGEKKNSDNCFSVYIGSWSNNKKNGQGMLKWANGQMYSGEWKDDKEHGRGTFSDGSSQYVGEWKNGSRYGEGECFFEDGDYYVGSFKDNKRSGYGVCQADGCVYEGGFLDDQMNGYGCLTRADGSKFVGFWHANVPFNGLETTADGVQLPPDFVNRNV